jgi:hypothetical protein
VSRPIPHTERVDGGWRLTRRRELAAAFVDAVGGFVRGLMGGST